MNPWTRRQLLRATALGALGMAARPILRPRPAFAAGEGSPANGWHQRTGNMWVQGDDTQYKILEIFMYGGLSPWETFYIRPEAGEQSADWYGAKAGYEALHWAVLNEEGGCEFPSDVPEVPPGQILNGTETRFFATDEVDNDVHFGPATRPLWKHTDGTFRDDLLDRMRVMVTAHDLLPHEAAIPYTMSGLKLGNPRRAGIGAPIQRHFMSNPDFADDTAMVLEN